MSESDRVNSSDAERYARLLAEAEAMQGTSLAADAWRRLKRNRVALASLLFLGVISLLALLTPLLPLQSPFAIDTKIAYEPPTVWPVMIQSLKVPDDGKSAAPRRRAAKGTGSIISSATSIGSIAGSSKSERRSSVHGRSTASAVATSWDAISWRGCSGERESHWPSGWLPRWSHL